MPQLSKTEIDRKFRQANRTGAKESRRLDVGGTTAKEASSGWTKLGYEVFNKRRAPHVQVPLNLSDGSATSSSYTGSALLDSFVRDRKTEPSSLDTLRLISIADGSPSESVNSKATSEAATGQQDEPQEKIKLGERDLPDDISDQSDSIDAVSVDDRLRAELIEKILIKESLVEAGLQSEATNIQTEAELTEAEPIGIESTDADFDSAAIEETDSVELARLEQASEPVEIQELVAEIPEAYQTADDLSDQQLEDAELEDAEPDPLDHPPEEALPDYLDGTPISSAPKSPSSHLVTPSSPPKQTPPQNQSSAPITQSIPAFSAVHQEKRARDGAASVGLIDITDTLLFGGDRPDLVSADPFIPKGSDLNVPGVLAYLTNQISAFTVDRLQSGFPYNTDPKVLNRLEQPKYKTVLSIDDFKLGQLVSSREEPKRLTGQQQVSPKNDTDVRSLSQQVEELNRKIADLTQKLAQVTDN